MYIVTNSAGIWTDDRTRRALASAKQHDTILVEEEWLLSLGRGDNFTSSTAVTTSAITAPETLRIVIFNAVASVLEVAYCDLRGCH